MSRARIAVLAFITSLALFAASGARAEEAHADSAASFFTAAEAAFARGEYRAAALAFEEAYRRAPRGATIYNGALAWERAQAPERAADAYALAAGSSDLPPERAGAARARVAELARKLGRIDVEGPSDVRVSIAHVVDRAPPFRVHVVPGHHSASITYPSGAGPAEARALDVAEGKVVPMTIAARVVPVAPPKDPPRAAEEGERPSRAPRIVGWVAIGTGVVASAAAITFGAMGLSARDAFEASGFSDEREHDRAVDFRTGANVAWVAAGVLMTTGVLLVLFSPKADSRRATMAEPLLRF